MSDSSRKSPDTADVRDACGRFVTGNPARRPGGRNKVMRAIETPAWPGRFGKVQV